VSKLIRRREVPQTNSLTTAGLHPLLARVYAGRGIASAEELDLSLERLLPPAGLHNAGPAATFLADALESDLSILVVGDFDADGATSTALAVSALQAFGCKRVGYLVPNRFEYGYGLTPEIVALAAERSPDIIITVDNGISSIEGVAAANELGIRTLVTDHHLAGRELPAAQVIVNPNQPECDFASKNLAGVGVIFYVMMALRAELRKRGWFDRHPEVHLGQFLDLVALGTVADVVPLDRNNRVLVAAGLKRVRAGQARPGINALMAVAGRNYGGAVASDFGFAVGPRVNAAGRLDDMSVGIECLLTTDAGRAQVLAEQLHQLNQDRRVIEKGMQQEAMQKIAELPLEAGEPPIAVTLYRGDWHQGVIGILASRIKDRLHRPTIAFADDDGEQVKGSARSIPGIHIRDILDAVATRHPGLVSRFGGHAMAAGLTLPRERYEEFAAAFVEEVARHAEDVNLQAIIDSDGVLSAAEFDLAVASELRYAGPWGQHFPEPVFDGSFEVVTQRIVGDRHLKLTLRPDEDGQTILDAIAFNVDLDTWPDESIQRVDVAYRLDVNEYRGRQSLQLMIEQILPA